MKLKKKLKKKEKKKKSKKAGKNIICDFSQWVKPHILPPPLARHVLFANKEVGAQIPRLTLLGVVKGDCLYKQNRERPVVKTLYNGLLQCANIMLGLHTFTPARTIFFAVKTKVSRSTSNLTLAKHHDYTWDAWQRCKVTFWIVAYLSQFQDPPSRWERLRTVPSGAWHCHPGHIAGGWTEETQREGWAQEIGNRARGDRWLLVAFECEACLFALDRKTTPGDDVPAKQTCL